MTMDIHWQVLNINLIQSPRLLSAITVHAHIWYTSYNCYSNRTLPIMEIIHFAMVNLSIKIILIISLFVILKHSINLPALTLDSHYCTVDRYKLRFQQVFFNLFFTQFILLKI
jgi:hypothetical protein